VLLLCSVCSARKLKKIKNLIVTIGGIASLARGGGGGFAKSLQFASQRLAASGQQYASSYANQPLVISTIISSLNTTTNTLHPITSTNTVSVNNLQPLASNNAVTVNTLQQPVSTSPVTIGSLQPFPSTSVVSAHQPTLGLVSQYTLNTALPLSTSYALSPYALPEHKIVLGASVGNPTLILTGQQAPVAYNGLIGSVPILHPVNSAHQPPLADPLLQSGWVR